MRPSVFILSQPKTATQSLFRTLKDSYPELGVFHAHTLDRADRMLAASKPGMSQEAHDHWRYRLSKQYHLLRSLLDARSHKTVVAVLREPVDRWSSALFYTHAKYITPCFDPVAQAYRLDQLRDALAPICRELLSDDHGYYARNYSILGMPQEAFAGGYRVTKVRDDLQVVTLAFESLANDFARLLEHLGLPRRRSSISTSAATVRSTSAATRTPATQQPRTGGSMRCSSAISDWSGKRRPPRSAPWRSLPGLPEVQIGLEWRWRGG